MATLDSLKWALRKTAVSATTPPLPLTDAAYSAGFDLLVQGAGWKAYDDFVRPQLTGVLGPLFDAAAETKMAVLEIGPGAESVLGRLPGRLRRQIGQYAAFEPNGLFAAKLEEWLFRPVSEADEVPLPGLTSPADIHRIPFSLDSGGGGGGDEKFDVVLLCHSLYGMQPKRAFVERVLSLLAAEGVAVVFHREGIPDDLDGLVCHRTALFPQGEVSVANDDAALDGFAPFVAGGTAETDAVRAEWRQVCRALGRDDSGQLIFSAPDVMMVFRANAATALAELTAVVPLAPATRDRPIKNREARRHRPAAVVRPTTTQHVQQCVRWAVQHRVGLTVVGGSHSDHCLWPGVVAVDMGAFDRVHVEKGPDKRVVVEAGCTAGAIVQTTLAAGVSVSLGARPSVGAGLWLQGGIGHLARVHGLACDAIVGAVVVSVQQHAGALWCVGDVPSEHWPAGAVRPDNDADVLWALRGAGTNFGIVVSVTLQAHPARTYRVCDWVVPLADSRAAQKKLDDFDRLVAGPLPGTASADAFLYGDGDELRLGVTMFESSTAVLDTTTTTTIDALGPPASVQVVDAVSLFDAEMYMSGMHGGHGGGKTSAFKRCLFLKRVGGARIANLLVAAVETRPSPLCYLHLLHGGGAVSHVGAEATAFGCRDWDFACVVTGVWPRDQDGTPAARAAVQWVYAVAHALLPWSRGIYGADLGPDPRDAALVVRAFGPNLSRLARLKEALDPHNVLAYACPLRLSPPSRPPHKLVVLVTGDSGAGKDYCAAVWATALRTPAGLSAYVISISEAAKRAYAAATGASLVCLLGDRAYKEQHRAALTAFFQRQVEQRPQLPAEHFQAVVRAHRDADVLLITGLRDEAPVASLWPLVPDCQLVEVRVQASRATRQARRGCPDPDPNPDPSQSGRADDGPDLVFCNDASGPEAAAQFARRALQPLVHHPDLARLADMVRPPVLDFPRPGIAFRHILGIAQQPGGLALCAALLQARFRAIGRWDRVDAIACCEAGGFVLAGALAARVDVPLALIRNAGKLPPPTLSVAKTPSHVSLSSSSSSLSDDEADRFEIGRDAIPRGASVVVMDDVLSTGHTLCAVLQLLQKAGVRPEDVCVLLVAEFPVHRGRARLRQRGFGAVKIQSLLVFDGA